jgi:hypothetical protein
MKFTGSNTLIMMLMFITIFTMSSLFAQEKRIKEKDLPVAVTKAFHTEYPAAKIIGTSTEVEKGVTYFEIESMDGKVRRDLLYTKEGKRSEIEETLTHDKIPDFVKTSIMNKYPKYEIKRAERVTSDNNKISYEVLVKMGHKRAEVVLDKDGKIIKSENLKREKEEKEEKESKEEKEEKDND